MFGVILLVFTVLMLLRVRLAFALLAVSLLYFWLVGMPLDIAAARVIATTQSFPLLAIPLFILAGNLMNQTGMTGRLFRFAEVLLGRVPGGLGHVVVCVGMLMAGTSGAAIADAAALARVSIDEMEKAGYPRPFAAAICAFAATMGPLIPPSIMFIIYGWLASESINRLFIAGAVPGLCVGLFMVLTIFIVARRNRFGIASKRPTAREFASAFGGAVWAMLMPVVVLGGIIIGAFTATEAAAIAVFYALAIGALVYRQLDLKGLLGALKETVVTAMSVMFIVAASYPFGWILTAEQVPQSILEVANQFAARPWLILLIVNLLLIGLGMVMESTAILLIVVPMLLPLMKAIGVDPAHFGVIVTANLLLGTITPPFGILMFTTCAVGKVTTLDFQKAAIPFYVAFLLLLAFVTYVPAVSLWLPSVLLN
ncbi:TRAP transporter large permease [Aurantimonas sp. C2-6-R+9]|uniref:TRAP transporter large permease n=1 Tax=unclassified Aurantimonas TaxID=2638230 RepID=UPI002E187287|nr:MULTISPECIES: TRAP transporter large permease [unclassified Aurantimonas]MEC5293249.1 TRAP transporter large permease [Aurantimonas sp. C2-3-R2]MEC5383389.1 TRAP transporter large permease [Aurantimonas sp. C2-6-R+9]MEC5414343.1 TRAP transporter large permease [Aurantimonas sp. C2-4-R8]